MQLLEIATNTKLSDLAKQVGSRNIDQFLAINGLQRTPNIGEAFQQVCNDIKSNFTPSGEFWQKQAAILNKFCGDSDIFEKAVLSSREDWKVIEQLGTLPMHLKVPDTVKLPDAAGILGNGVSVPKSTYNNAMSMLSTGDHTIDPVIFNEYTSTVHYEIVNQRSSTSLFHEFNLPWGQITLYSSLSQESANFPVYPEELDDGVVANFSTMPDMLYQYEPWQIYQSSGPRQTKFTFVFHRDMWTGDHNDGMANKLIRFCEANCFVKFNGSAVDVPTVSLYIAGKNFVTGVMTDCSTTWSGPIGQDGWYLECTLAMTIIEVSPQALDYDTVLNKPLIG